MKAYPFFNEYFVNSKMKDKTDEVEKVFCMMQRKIKRNRIIRLYPDIESLRETRN